MECQLPQSWMVVSRLSQRRVGRRGGDGGNLNVLRVCGVHTAISKQTRMGESQDQIRCPLKASLVIYANTIYL